MLFKNPIKGGQPLSSIISPFKEAKARRAYRRQPTKFGFAFAESINFLSAPHWDEVTVGNTIFLRRDILATIEKHLPENILPRYALIFLGDKPVAALSAQIVTVTRERFSKENLETMSRKRDFLKRTLKKAVGSAADKVKERMLVAGNLLSWGFHGIAFAPDLNPVDLWAGVAEALYRIRRAEKLEGQTDFVMVKDFTESQIAADELARFSYRKMDTEPNMVLELNPNWKTYEDYLAALDAKYRRNSKDQIKKLLAAGCVVEEILDLTPHADRLHDLYLSVQQKAKVRLVTASPGYLPALAQAAGQNFSCIGIRRGEELLGFVTCLRDGETAIAYYIGFDRDAADAGIPLYLRLLHQTIDQAIKWGCKRLSLGRTALEPKAALGAKPQPMNVWLRHRVAPMNWIIRSILTSIPHNEAPERSPFKTVQKDVSPES